MKARQPAIISIDESPYAATPSHRAAKAKAFIERASRPDLFPDPTVEESVFVSSYYTLEYRARLIAEQQASQKK